ncbi:MAG: HD domain-containing protein [Deltaproteobacteria bacterium]|nr:HD domain-containing protein [Deltaproteobacteria bacterium]
MPRPPIRAVLVDPEGRERSALIRGPAGVVRVGRAPENDIQVISPYISRRHAELALHDDGVQFRDLRSTSGSYLDGRRITEVVLQPGQAVRLGSPDGIRLNIQEPQRGGVWPRPALSSGDFSAVDLGEDPEAADDAPDHTEIVQVAALESSPYLSASVVAANQRKNGKTEERLRTLISATQEFLSVSTVDALVGKLLQEMMKMLPVERGMVLLDEGGELKPVRWLVRGEEGSAVFDPLASISAEVLREAVAEPDLPFHPIQTVTNRVFAEGVGLLTLDAPSDQRLEGSKSVLLQSVRSILAAPLSTAEGIHGVLYLDTRRALRKDDGDALDFLMAVSRQAGTVLRQLQLLDRQKRMFESMMRGLAASIDKRDGLTAGHSARVAHYSVGTAEELGLDETRRYSIYYAAMLHDYGKIGVDDAVLKKPARLTPAEYEHIKLHPRYTYDILSKIAFPPELADLPMTAASHHERMDGAGYPFGLQGEEIPLGGRIIAVADVYDSLTRKRHYRDPMPLDEVLDHLEEGRGERFDPKVLDAFFRYHTKELAMKEERRRRKRARGVDEAPTTAHETVMTGEPTDYSRTGPIEGLSVLDSEDEVVVVEPTLRLEP